MRKRVDTMQKEGMTNPRQTIWTAIRDLAGEDLAGQFTVTDIVDRTGVHRKTASDYFACLVAAEYLAQTVDTPPRFTLRKDSGVHAPRVRRDGKAVTQGAGTLNMWRSMRALSQFTYRDIALHSTTPTVSVPCVSRMRSICSAMHAPLKGNSSRPNVWRKLLPMPNTTPTAPPMLRWHSERTSPGLPSKRSE